PTTTGRARWGRACGASWRRRRISRTCCCSAGSTRRAACRGPSWAPWTRPSITSGSWNGATAEGDDAVDDALLAGFPVVVELPVNWGEMDAYRHVNNVVYFRYFENARLEYFRRLPRIQRSTTPGSPRRARW